MNNKTTLLTLFILLGFALPAHASLMKATWTTEVVHIDSDVNPDWLSIWSVGDSISISGVFDQCSTSFKTFYDGNNGIAEFGAGDDTLDKVHFITPPDAPSMDGIDFIADYNLKIDGKILATQSITADDTNQNTRLISLNNDYYPNKDIYWGMTRKSDGLFFVLREGNRGGALYDFSEGSDLGMVRFGNTSVTFSPQPVPEPTTMLLFVIGLVSLVGSKIRRQKK